MHPPSSPGFMGKIDLNDFRVATSETVRDINSRIMLNLVRKHQPVSRADLMRFSGLQRSTVSAIAERLIADRWLREGETGNLPRGRKPTFLHLNAGRCAVIGVDVQPASTTVAVASMDARLLAQESAPTLKDPDDFIMCLCSRIKDLLRAHPRNSYEGIGISLPGRIDAATGRLIFAPTLGWSDLDLKTPIENVIGLPVKLENAANACALAELWSGYHTEGVGNVVAVTVSDDIGVGMIMNGQLIRGSTGLAGEFGHVVLMPNGPLCRCGNSGCWEALASNSAAVRYYAEATSVPKGEIGSKSDMVTVPFTDILRLVEQGDPKACRALNRMAHHLGAGLAMLATGLAPDVLVVVGEVTRAWGKVEPIISAAIQRALSARSSIRIFAGDLELQPRLRGIIALVLQKHFVALSIA
jgi:predicted NBD/HSP70 family sugar kinase